MSTQKRECYPIRKNMPVAKFYYQGNHSHPVRRTVLIIEANSEYIRGYEMREGSVTRSFSNAPIRIFARKHIAKVKQCGFRLRRRIPKKYHENSTLKTMRIIDVVTNGL
jgi:hypothetical protein